MTWMTESGRNPKSGKSRQREETGQEEPPAEELVAGLLS